MAIKTTMSGEEIDRNLKAILDIQNVENDEMVLYIRKGELSCAEGEILFTIQHLQPTT